MGKTVKMGLLGMGRIGKLHAMNIQNSLPNAEIIVAVDPFLNEEMEAWAKGIGITNCSKDPKDVFENSPQEQESRFSVRSQFIPTWIRLRKLWLRLRRQG